MESRAGNAANEVDNRLLGQSSELLGLWWKTGTTQESVEPGIRAERIELRVNWDKGEIVRIGP